MRRQSSGSSGFTLIEVLISIVILSVGLLGVAFMQVTGTKGNTVGREISQGSFLAQKKMESLIQQGYDSVGNGTETTGEYTIAWNATEGHFLGDTKTIRLEVTWDKDGRTREVTVSRTVPRII
jgi:type IV pilus assembly protein PilV